MTKKIIGMGNAVLDILTKVENNFIDENNLSKGTMAIVSEDESQKILEKIEMIKTDSGGSVANTISTISLLGLEASFCGKVMNDKLGNDFENKMTESGTNFLCDKSNSGLPTARCIVFVTPDGERTMQTFLGASTTLSAADDILRDIQEGADSGPVAGRIAKATAALGLNPKAANFNTKLETFRKEAIAALRGAQVGPLEEASFNAILPSINDPENVIVEKIKVAKNKIQQLDDRLGAGGVVTDPNTVDYYSSAFTKFGINAQDITYDQSLDFYSFDESGNLVKD